MPRYIIQHPVSGQKLAIDGPAMPSPAEQQMIFMRHRALTIPRPSSTRDLYTKLVEQVLPEMNRPVKSQELLAMVEKADAGELAESTGFADWVRGQTTPITRGVLMSRLMREPAFRSLLAEHSGKADAPIWQAVPGLVQNTEKAQKPTGNQKLDAQVTGVTSLAPSEDESIKGDGT